MKNVTIMKGDLPQERETKLLLHKEEKLANYRVRGPFWYREPSQFFACTC